MEKEEILRMARTIQAIVVKSGQSRLRPKEVMPDLIAQGFFRKDEKFGKPLRDVLNMLDRTGQLGLIPQVVAERQEKAVYWYFEAAEMPEPVPVKKAIRKPAAKKAATVKEPKTSAVKKPAAKLTPAKKATKAVSEEKTAGTEDAAPVKKRAAAKNKV